MVFVTICGHVLIDRATLSHVSVEYRVKGDDASAGKEVCVEKFSRGDLGILPVCDKDKAAARFVKTRTLIHIPAGSMDKIVTVTSE